MRNRSRQCSQWIIAVLGLLAPFADANAMGDPALAYETVEPARIKLGETATIRVTSLDGYLEDFHLPSVTGLTFELVGRSQGYEFINGRQNPTWYILIRVTPQSVGIFSIPGLTPKSPTVGLEVYKGEPPNPYVWHKPEPTQPPAPMSKAPVPKGIQLEAGGAAYSRLVVPTRPMYVGEIVPVDIELGIRPGVVTALDGPPALSGGDFTLNNLSKQPLRREQLIADSAFLIMTWHSALAAVKPGDFSLSVETPLTVRLDTRSDVDRELGAMMGWPFSQIASRGSAPPKDMKIASPSSELKVLPLPTRGRPRDFSGAVGDFQVSSDATPARVAAGDPLTLHLRISGVGNFDRVDTAMLDHLDHWKTYPPKSSFKASDAAQTQGEKVFEQPLIAERPGEQTIPPLEFSYFNPRTQRYEQAFTQPIKVLVSASLADSSGPGDLNGAASGLTSSGPFAQGLRPDHPQVRTSVRELQPLYFQPAFLTVPATLAMLLAVSWFTVRPQPRRTTSKGARRALAQLETAARSGDSSVFFAAARTTLLQTFADRWQMSPDQITATELKSRLGTEGEHIERLFALADEAKYSHETPEGKDFQRWLGVVRDQLDGAATSPLATPHVPDAR